MVRLGSHGVNTRQMAGTYLRVADPGWADPLDSSFAQRLGGRWNAPDAHATLYLTPIRDWSDQDAGTSLDSVDPVAVRLARTMLERSSDPARRDYGRRSDADLLRSLGVVTARGTLAKAGALLFSGRLDVGDQLSYVHRRTPAGALLANELSAHPCWRRFSGRSTSSRHGSTARP
jgi:hypothetical protein